jgi:hypothetical protein
MVWTWRLIYLTVFLVVFITGDPLANCLDIYPDAQLIVSLGKVEYQDCSLNVMVKDYADILKEQEKLIEELMPAYTRKLNKDFDIEERRQVRLNAYVTEFLKLHTVIKDFSEWTEEIDSPDIEDEEAEDGLTPHSELKSLLSKGNECSQALKRKVMFAKDELEGNESSAYCKLDFYFRLRKELHQKIEACAHPTD